MLTKNSKLRTEFTLLILIISYSTLFGTTYQADRLQRQIDDYHKQLSKIQGYDVTNDPTIHEEDSDGNKSNKEKVFGSKRSKIRECTGQSDFEENEHKEYLEAFAKGGCSPVVLIPGITGSKLVAKIDCEVLKQKSPEVFEACGWESCDPESGSEVPKSEYLIWIPEISSPMSLLRGSGKARLCFQGVMGFKVTKVTDDEDNKEKVKFETSEGIEVRVLGDTQESTTFEASHCGFDAVRNLAPGGFQLTSALYYRDLINRMRKRGYKIGLTMQALPFDWRKKVGDDEYRFKMRKILKEMYEMTGKKVTILTHSLGSFYALDLLWSMGQAEKDRMVARWIALAPPLVGSTKATRQLIGKISKETNLIDQYLDFFSNFLKITS